jgi:competence protein ComEA
MDDSHARYRPYLAMLVLFLVLLTGTVLFFRRPEPAAIVIQTPTPRPTATVAVVLVDVRGAVARPGVYSLPGGSRVQDALTLAGGLLSNADNRNLNLARKLNDGEQIYIPTQGEATLQSVPPPARTVRPATPTKTSSGVININSATVEELDRLPGIGPAIAQRIVDYRNQNGPFKKIEDLKQVRGIGDSLFAQIKDLVQVQ